MPPHSQAAPSFLSVVITGALITASPLLPGQSLKIDIQQNGGITQSGWQAWDLSGTFSSGDQASSFPWTETTDGTLEVTLDPGSSAGARAYGLDTVTDPGNLTIPDVWADQFFFNNNAGSSLRITLTDLNAGDYSFTSYHFANNLNGDGAGSDDEGTASVSVDTGNGAVDTGLEVHFVAGNESQVAITGPGVLAAELDSFATFTTTFTVAGNGDPVEILFGPLSSGDTFGLNGFTLGKAGPDTTPPTVLSLNPPDDATAVPAGANLVITFNEDIQAGAGSITLKRSGDNTTVEAYEVATSPLLAFGSDKVTIDPSTDLTAGTGYHVEIASGAIEDSAGNAFAGFSGDSTWNFTAATPISLFLQVQTTTDLAGTALQAGWDLVDGDRGAASISGLVDGVTVTVAGTNGAPALGRSGGGDGGGYLEVDHTDGDLDHLLSGGRLTNTGDALTLTLGGLADGDYEIVTYHHSPYDGSFDGVFEFDVLLTDANGTNVVVHDNIVNSHGATVTTAELAAPLTPFTVSGGNGVTLSFDPVAGFDDGGGSDQMHLNGFELADAGPDTSDPLIVDLSPGDDSEAILGADLVATFDDAIAPGTGFITIHTSGGAVVESFEVATSPRLTFSGFAKGTVTIDPSNDLVPGSGYYVLIDPTAIDDNAGNSFAGISDPATWNFTGDGTAPSGSGLPDLTGSGSLTLSFDEEVLRGSGNIVIRRATDGTVVHTIDVASASVVINGPTVTIQPGALDPDTTYYVEIDAGAFTDRSGNPFAGFSGNSAWVFSTPDNSLAGVPPAGGTSLGAAFEAWIAQFPAAGTHVGPYHNPDGSGFNSFGEFAFDGHPLVSAVDGVLPSAIATVGGQQVLTLTVPVRDGAVFSGSPALLSDPIDGISYGIEASRDLSLWDVAVSEVTGPDAATIQAPLPALSPGWSYRTFRMPGSTTSEPAMFFRAFADDIPIRIQQARDSSVIASYALGKVKRWLNEVAIPKINGNDLYVAHNGGSARYSSWWNYDDTAADCYPFLFWAAYYTDIDQINTTDGPVHDVLVAEQLHCNLNDTPGSPYGSVPTAVNPDTLVKEISSYTNTMFAASEYVKDGLIPIVEVMGTGNPWFDRLQGIIDDMWANAQVNTAYGLVPTTGTEANGEQLQALARLYTMTGDPKYLDWGERLADQYLLSGTFVPSSLRDHGCEIVGGLGLFYAVESVHRPAKAATWLPGLRHMLDEILDRGTNADGIMYNSIGGGGLSDGWGYNYPAFLCHDLAVTPPRYSLGLQQTLRNLAKPTYATAWGSNIDENADSIEGGLYQINRFQIPEAIAWADQEMADHVTRSQNPDVNTTSLWGTYKLESNGVRTVLQHAMMHTRGLIARPWELDLELGASQTADGVVVMMKSTSGWSGVLEVDKPRHQLNMGFTRDWPRMNTMPEWFVAEPNDSYVVEDLTTGTTSTYTGAQLHAGLPVTLGPGVETLLWIRK